MCRDCMQGMRYEPPDSYEELGIMGAMGAMGTSRAAGYQAGNHGIPGLCMFFALHP